MYFCISVFVTLAHVASNLKSLNHKINDKETIGLTKYSREKSSDPWNTREKILDPRNTHEKKILDPRNTHEGTVARWH